MPSILIELGFISYLPEGEYLNSDAGQDAIAEAIVKGIIAYRQEYFVAGTVDYVEPAPGEHKTAPAVTDKPAKPEQATASSQKGETFRIQIAASAKDLDPVPSNFKGLKKITKEKGKSIIKYFYGDTTDKEEAKALLSEAKAKGYEEAFIVTFRDGKKI
jgi:N-acetylmuramoyl-L-alanine amidase